MKVWDSSRIREGKSSCLTTIREHSGPIFTAVEAEGYILTGGMEGVVRCWSLPRREGASFSKCLSGQWNNSEEQKLEPVWQLLYDSETKTVFSTSSEVAIRAFGLAVDEEGVSGKYRNSFLYQSKGS